MIDSFKQAQDSFADSLRQAGKANATVIAYAKDIEQLLGYMEEIGRTGLSEIKSEDIDEFKELLKRQRYTSKSVSRKLNSIKAFFRFMMTSNTLVQNPADSVAHPKFDQSIPRILSRMEYRALRDACRPDLRMAAVVELLLQTGMRISELAALEIQEVDLDHNVASVKAQNSRGERKVPLNAAAKRALTEYLAIRPRAREKTLFLTKTCRPFLVRNIRTALDRYFRLAGIRDAKVNDLRHTFIVEQLKAGTPLVYVSQLVGHKRITTTEKYLQFIEAPDLAPSVQIEEL